MVCFYMYKNLHIIYLLIRITGSWRSKEAADARFRIKVPQQGGRRGGRHPGPRRDKT